MRAFHVFIWVKSTEKFCHFLYFLSKMRNCSKISGLYSNFWRIFGNSNTLLKSLVLMYIRIYHISLGADMAKQGITKTLIEHVIQALHSLTHFLLNQNHSSKGAIHKLQRCARGRWDSPIVKNTS